MMTLRSPFPDVRANIEVPLPIPAGFHVKVKEFDQYRSAKNGGFNTQFYVDVYDPYGVKIGEHRLKGLVPAIHTGIDECWADAETRPEG